MRNNFKETTLAGHEDVMAAYQRSLDSKKVLDLYKISNYSLDKFLKFVQYSAEHNFKKSSMVMISVNHDPSKMVIYMSQLLLERGIQEVSFVNMAALSEEDLQGILDLSDMHMTKEKVIYYYNKDYAKSLSTHKNKKYGRSALEAFDTLSFLLHSHSVNVRIRESMIKTVLNDMSNELDVDFSEVEKNIILNSLGGELDNLPQAVFDMLHLKNTNKLPHNVAEFKLLIEKAEKFDEVMEIMGKSILR